MIDCNAVRWLISMMSKWIYTIAIYLSSSLWIVEGCDSANRPLLPAIADRASSQACICMYVEPTRPSRALRYIRPVQGDQAEVGRPSLSNPIQSTWRNEAARYLQYMQGIQRKPTCLALKTDTILQTDRDENKPYPILSGRTGMQHLSPSLPAADSSKERIG